MDIDLIKSILINTAVLSSMYILASLGFAFIFNMMGSINLAHGAVYMLSAYLCYYITVWFGLSNWMALLIAAIVMAVFGLFLERFNFRPFLDDFSRIIMLGVALMTLLQTTTTVLSGTKILRIESFATGTSKVIGVSVGNEKIVTFLIGLILLLAVLFIVYRTKLGRQMEAIAQNRIGAALQGININGVSATVCAIGCALAAVSGSLMGAYQRIAPTMGDNIQLRILMLVMLAGAGSMNGVIVTGIIMGFLDSCLPVFIQGYGADAVAACIIIVLLLIRPKGFFGHEI